MNIFKTQGVRGLFRGAPATAIRDTPSMGLYFASYETVKERLESRWGFGEQASSFWAGGLAGALSWFVIYPFDVVKSVQQVGGWVRCGDVGMWGWMGPPSREVLSLFTRK